MAPESAPKWTFLTRHAQILLCIADDPGIRLRDIGDRLGITERAAHRIVVELVDDGYLTRERRGRRNHYTIRPTSRCPTRSRAIRRSATCSPCSRRGEWSSPG